MEEIIKHQTWPLDLEKASLQLYLTLFALKLKDPCSTSRFCPLFFCFKLYSFFMKKRKTLQKLNLARGSSLQYFFFLSFCKRCPSVSFTKYQRSEFISLWFLNRGRIHFQTVRQAKERKSCNWLTILHHTHTQKTKSGLNQRG